MGWKDKIKQGWEVTKQKSLEGFEIAKEKSAEGIALAKEKTQQYVDNMDICEICGNKMDGISRRKVVSQYISSDKKLCKSCLEKGKLPIKCKECGNEIIAKWDKVLKEINPYCDVCDKKRTEKDLENFDYKTASDAELRKQFNHIAEEMGDDQFFTKKELKHLPEILQKDEQVLAFTSGNMGLNTWLITLTDRRIIFLDKGMVYGLKQTSIDLDKISSISGETGIMFGEIKINTGSESKKITNVWKKTVKNFANKAQEVIYSKKNRPSQPAQMIENKEPDKYEKLEKLAALKEKGILTEEEFNIEKKKIIDI